MGAAINDKMLRYLSRIPFSDFPFHCYYLIPTYIVELVVYDTHWLI